jgi:hypothetical protein
MILIRDFLAGMVAHQAVAIELVMERLGQSVAGWVRANVKRFTTDDRFWHYA